MYNYQIEKSKIFTDEGQKNFLKVRDRVHKLLNESGAFMMTKAWKDVSGDSWLLMAYVDRMVELGEIVELKRETAGQHRVFIAASL